MNVGSFSLEVLLDIEKLRLSFGMNRTNPSSALSFKQFENFLDHSLCLTFIPHRVRKLVSWKCIQDSEKVVMTFLWSSLDLAFPVSVQFGQLGFVRQRNLESFVKFCFQPYRKVVRAVGYLAKGSILTGRFNTVRFSAWPSRTCQI